MSAVRRDPEQILIFDTTLRDGAQSPGIALSTDRSLEIAQQLNRLGVDIIEAGFPASSPGNFEAVQTIAQQVEGPVIAGLARTHKSEIESVARAVKDAAKPRIHTFISTSDIHIRHQLQTTRADVLGQARAAVAHAKSFVDDVEFSPMDATRADVDFTAEVCQTAIEEGATTINVPDTVGYTQPYEFEAYLGRLYELVPALGSVVLSVHCHDDLGLAVANTFAGIRAGARQAEVAINGLGERAGNASLEELVMLLRTRRHVDGFDTGINTQELGPTSRMVARHTGYRVPFNKAVVGRNAFQHEAGIHQDGVIKERSTYEIMSAASVGMDTQSIVLGKQSGRRAIRQALEEGGIFKAPYLNTTFELFKDLADRIGAISREQIVEIHEEAERRQTNPYDLEEMYCSSSTGGGYRARVKLSRRTNQERITASAPSDYWSVADLPDASRQRPIDPEIDGQVSALFTALSEATVTDYKVQDFQITSIGEGKQTIGKATVTIRLNGKTVAGHGLSLDVLKASAWAYLDAIKKANEHKVNSTDPSVQETPQP
jgi:2-isopropylmalate synthase